MCHFEELLNMMPDDCVQKITQGQDIILALPRRTPTPEEREKIKMFAAQVDLHITFIQLYLCLLQVTIIIKLR